MSGQIDTGLTRYTYLASIKVLVRPARYIDLYVLIEVKFLVLTKLANSNHRQRFTDACNAHNSVFLTSDGILYI